MSSARQVVLRLTLVLLLEVVPVDRAQREGEALRPLLRHTRRLDLAPLGTGAATTGGAGRATGGGCGIAISTRRFLASRTPSAVGTRGSVSPSATAAIAPSGTPRRTSSRRTVSTRRSDNLWL